MGNRDSEDNGASSHIKHWIAVVIVGLVAYQVFTGVTLKKVGIPGVLDLEFHDRNQSPPANAVSPPAHSDTQVTNMPSTTGIPSEYVEDGDIEVEIWLDEEPEPEQQQTTSINVAYSGDVYGCTLPITIDIGGVAFVPTGNYYTVSGVGVGTRNYQISGQIHCPGVGSCQVYGQGAIAVQPQQTYQLLWQNTGYAECVAQLQ